MVRRYWSLASLLIILLAFPLQAIAQSGPTDGIRLTTSPLPIDLTTTPGKPVTTQLRVRNSGSHNETLKVGLLTFSAQGDSGKPTLRDKRPGDDFFDWVTFSPQQFTLAPNQWQTVAMTISPPASAAFGYYYAVTFSRVSEQKPVQAASLSGAAATLVLLEVHVPGANRQLSVSSFTANKPWYEFLPATFATVLRNSGNVHAAPYGTIYISRVGQSQIIDQLDINQAKGNVLPDSSRAFSASWSNGFPVYRNKTANGQTVLDSAGQPEQQLQWDFSQANKLRFGKYTAHLVMAYDNGQGKDVPLEATVDFWVVPWRIILAGLVTGLLVLAGLWSIGRSVWRLIRPSDSID
jgi:hypothetical protein